jgi:hypothetical protein
MQVLQCDWTGGFWDTRSPPPSESTVRYRYSNGMDDGWDGRMAGAGRRCKYNNVHAFFVVFLEAMVDVKDANLLVCLIGCCSFEFS